jgi:hypothetical protein
VNARNSLLLVGCLVAAIGLTACDRTVGSTAALAAETLTPESRTYKVESNELIEISQFEDGSVKYTPTGFLVISTKPSATATAAPHQQ